jgi:hypothetical protein
MKEETTQLITDIYGIFQEREANMFDAYVATMSIAASIAANHGVTEDEFLRDCRESFEDGSTVSKMNFTIN